MQIHKLDVCLLYIYVFLRFFQGTRLIGQQRNSNVVMAATDNSKKLSRWYFGGLGSAGAACCTHPLDLLKVITFNYLPIIPINNCSQ